MKTATHTFYIALLGLIAVLGFQTLISANWQGPQAAAPGSNVPAPINTGTSTESVQVKQGTLALRELVAEYITAAQNLVIAGGSSDPTDLSVSADLSLDVNGKVGATEYCDKDGSNCFAPSSVGGSSLPNCNEGESLIMTSGSWACGTAGDPNATGHPQAHVTFYGLVYSTTICQPNCYLYTDHNIDRVERLGVGTYRIYFSQAFAASNGYTVAITPIYKNASGGGTALQRIALVGRVQTLNSSYIDVITGTATALEDVTRLSVAVFGAEPIITN